MSNTGQQTRTLSTLPLDVLKTLCKFLDENSLDLMPSFVPNLLRHVEHLRSKRKNNYLILCAECTDNYAKIEGSRLCKHIDYCGKYGRIDYVAGLIEQYDYNLKEGERSWCRYRINHRGHRQMKPCLGRTLNEV